MTEEKDKALKEADTIRIYGRVSTPEQEGTIEGQVETVMKAIDTKTKKKVKIEVYSEQESGTKIDRPELQRMLADVKALHEANPKKKQLVVVRDIQRFTRDPYDLGELYNPIRRLDVPILSVNEPIITGTPKRPSPQADLLAPILTAAGGAEVQTRLKQTLQGVDRSRDAGIFAGTPLSLYPDDALEPRREQLRLLAAGVGQSEGSRRLGRSSGYWRKNRDVMAEYALAGVLDDWLNTIDLIRAMEQEKGEGKGPKAGVKMKIVRRMTSGYLNDPVQFRDMVPTQADLDEYFSNFNLYKPKRKK